MCRATNILVYFTTKMTKKCFSKIIYIAYFEAQQKYIFNIHRITFDNITNSCTFVYLMFKKSKHRRPTLDSIARF